MQVETSVIMRTVFALQIRNKLRECLIFLGHHRRQQQGVEDAIALGKMTGDADAARLLAANEDVALEHEIADELEADAALMQLASVAGGDAVEHAGGVE